MRDTQAPFPKELPTWRGRRPRSARRALTPATTARVRVLFVCFHNAARSQIAQGFFEQLGGLEHSACSAGTHPAKALNPQVVEVMAEVGIDLRGRTPRRLTPSLLEVADVVVRLLRPDPEDWPWPEGTRYLDWELELPADPDTRDLNEIRKLRDQVRTRVEEFAASLGTIAR